MKKFFALTFIAVAFASNAMADQCQYITKAQAVKAAKLLASAKSIDHFCEPCNEARPTHLQVLTQLGLRYTGSNEYWTVSVNNEDIDLAYTYVNSKNLAMLVKCDVHGVSETLGGPAPLPRPYSETHQRR